jgi:hypothetical protein
MCALNEGKGEEKEWWREHKKKKKRSRAKVNKHLLAGDAVRLVFLGHFGDWCWCAKM